ncbi:signal transduction histidine kinase [Saccharothrix coeruleofusca]|uniref:sensor histidine kinase n=1 Tax=Saccharothrix coeruleofusca TaxID=33919 RepID=UPI001AE6B805|nr:histidine kinase [Saccharothrix coeruleofusca]MBP2335929.1 signal transduction histidine kinase [Saccharothrix coeruleofusca]
MTAPGVQARRGVLVAEIAALVATTAVDSALAVRWQAPSGVATPLLATAVPPVGTAVAVLAALRRRFPRRIGGLGAAVVGLSLLSTGFSALTDTLDWGSTAYPATTEVLACVLLVGAGCRRLPPVGAVVLAAAAGAAVVAAPVVRHGLDSPAALLAAPAALLWGVALAVGLVLRDADARHLAALDRVRTNERLQLARELHDLVAHHVSGIVVRVQAARALSGNPSVPEQESAAVYADIERAGAEALVAMRRLVGMLRSTEHALPPPDSRLGDVVRAVAADRAVVDVAEELDDLPVPPELSGTVHRVLLEALTNVQRHSPEATEVRVTARVEDDHLVLDVGNDGVPERPADRHGGYGITGMTERVAALGGTLEAGPRPAGRWHTTARLPMGPEETPFGHLPRGV